MTYKIGFTPRARAMLEAIRDRRVREKIQDRIDALSVDPDKQGKPLTDELAGYRSLRAVGQRYRIVYRVERGRVLVLIVAVGIRKEGSKRDIYTLARRLIRLHLLEPPSK